MNLVFGTLESGEPQVFASLLAATRELYGEVPRRVGGAEGAIRIGALAGDGVVSGSAEDEEGALVLLGGLHRPLPDWTGGPPPDDPDRAAAWLLRRWRTEGNAFLDQVMGQYAVLIRDRGGRRLVAACGPGGTRSLFVHRSGGGVAISSNLFLLARALRDRVGIDRSLEDFFLVYGYLPGGRTLFDGIETMAPGAVHLWEDGEYRVHQVADPDPWAGRMMPLDPGEAPEEDVMDGLYEALMTATEEQTGSAREVAVMLGGVDSALVASALNRLGKEVHTYSFHYDEPGFDQPHTDTLSEFLGSRHHWVRITPEVMRDGLEDYGLIFSRPTNWPNYVIQTARVCEVIREDGILHVHSGDGCDHTFMGYPRTHTLSRLYQSLPRLPSALGRLLVAVAARPWLEDLLGRPYRVGMNVLRNLSRPWPERGFLSFRVFDESSLERLRRGPPPPQEAGIEAMLESLTRGLEDLSPARLAYRGKAGVSANKAKLGGSSDHTGVITYAPYLHPGLKRLAEGLPDRLLRPGTDEDTATTGKYVLLKMAERKGLLPREVIYQEKVAAVDAPVDDWYAGPLREEVLELLEHLPFEVDGEYVERLVEPTRAARLYATHLSSDRITTHEVSLLATYAALARALD